MERWCLQTGKDTERDLQPPSVTGPGDAAHGPDAGSVRGRQLPQSTRTPACTRTGVGVGAGLSQHEPRLGIFYQQTAGRRLSTSQATGSPLELSDVCSRRGIFSYSPAIATVRSPSHRMERLQYWGAHAGMTRRCREREKGLSWGGERAERKHKPGQAGAALALTAKQPCGLGEVPAAPGLTPFLFKMRTHQAWAFQISVTWKPAAQFLLHPHPTCIRNPILPE